MRGTGAALALAAGLVAALAFSGGTGADPQPPHGFPGIRPSFLDGNAEVRVERRWLGRARSLPATAPAWARRMHTRSLLALRALTDLRSGGAVAGAPEGWAYVWPRDAAVVAIAFAAAGYRPEARRVARFLLQLDLDAAARFGWDGEPVDGREAQGDAAGWVAAAVQASELRPTGAAGRGRRPAGRSTDAWAGRADYHEKDGGEYLGNAIAAGASGAPFVVIGSKRRTGSGGGAGRSSISGSRLVRVAGDPESGWDSAAAWAVRPFPQPALFPLVRRTLLRIAAASGRFGILPSEGWDGGVDPWTAPTAWTAWGLAALAREDRRVGALETARRERRAALRLMAALRRAATPLGMLPERVDARTGAARSTTPLAWSHAFAILALRELWPGRAAS